MTFHLCIYVDYFKFTLPFVYATKVYDLLSSTYVGKGVVLSYICRLTVGKNHFGVNSVIKICVSVRMLSLI